MDAYRSELDAAERRLERLNDEIAERERELGAASSTPASPRRRWTLIGSSVAFFAAVTAAAALSFARAPMPKLEASDVAPTVVVDEPSDEDHELPLLAKLRDKVELGTATVEEREALDVLLGLHEQNHHLRRSFAAMTRLADDRLRPSDLVELGRYCYLGGHRRCLALVEQRASR